MRQYNNASSITNMLEDLGWHIPEQRQIDSWLTALFKIALGLLVDNSHRLLWHVMHRTHLSHSESFIWLQTSLSSEYPSFFFKNSYSVEQFSCFCL